MNNAVIYDQEGRYNNGKIVLGKLGIILASQKTNGIKNDPWEKVIGLVLGLIAGHYVDVEILPKNPELVELLDMIDKSIISPYLKMAD